MDHVPLQAGVTLDTIAIPSFGIMEVITFS